MEKSNILQKLNESTLKFLEPLTLEATFEIVDEEAKKLVGADYCSIFLNKNGELIRTYASVPELFRMKIAPGKFVYQSFKEMKPILLSKENIISLPKVFGGLGIQSIVLIPLSYKHHTIGVLSVLSKNKKTFTEKEFRTLQLFGSMASLAIRKTQLHLDAEKAIEDRNLYKHLETVFEKVYKGGLQFLQPLSLQETYHIIIQETMRLLSADSGSLYLAQNKELRRVASIPISKNIEVRRRGYTYKAYKEKKIFIIQGKEITKAHPELKGTQYKSAICLPLFYHRKSLGALILLSKENYKFSQKEKGLIQVFGSYASLAIRKAHSHKEALDALATRDLFISMAAHELRTPITSIYGYVQLLHRKTVNVDTPQARWINQLFLESTRLTRLVNELLEISRIQSGKFQFVWKECDIVTNIEHSIESIRFSHPEHTILFENDLKTTSCVVIGDSDKLQQVFINLLDNAAKFSPTDKSIVVRAEKNKRHVIITIIDKGKGIDKKDLSRLFEQFYKGKNSHEIGMGLGLFLAKNIIEHHHGFIQVTSSENKGTNVKILLPQMKSS